MNIEGVIESLSDKYNVSIEESEWEETGDISAPCIPCPETEVNNEMYSYHCSEKIPKKLKARILANTVESTIILTDNRVGLSNPNAFLETIVYQYNPSAQFLFQFFAPNKYNGSNFYLPYNSVQLFIDNNPLRIIDIDTSGYRCDAPTLQIFGFMIVGWTNILDILIKIEPYYE